MYYIYKKKKKCEEANKQSYFCENIQNLLFDIMILLIFTLTNSTLIKIFWTITTS